MTKIDIISGFLGAGKTTLIKKLLKEALPINKTVLIENEFGEIGIDGGFLKESGIQIREMNSGCICCSLVGDFGTSLKEVCSVYAPERIVIEPSGVGKLSDVIKAVRDIRPELELTLNSASVVVDAAKCKMYVKNFGEFFINQIENARTILLSRTDKVSEKKLNECISIIRQYNEAARLVTTSWEELDGSDILRAMEADYSMEEELMGEIREHHDHARGACGCGGGHAHDHGACGCGGGHAHDHGACGCSGGHAHDHGACGCSGGHNHDLESGYHHADDVFNSWGMETPAVYGKDEIAALLAELENEKEYGLVLRAKGMVPGGNGKWIYFDYVPGECDIREGKPFVTGKICVIGSGLNEEPLKKLFRDAETER